MKEHTVMIIRRWLLLFIIALFISGLTAIPVDEELKGALTVIPHSGLLYQWINNVLASYEEVKLQYPYLLYGYDWLAFAHFVLAILFIGPYQNPMKNIWVIQFGLIACLLILPFAFIAGHFRAIPLGWRLIDCSFGIGGFPILWYCYRKTKELRSYSNYSSQNIQL